MYLLYGARPYVDEGLDDYIARLAYWNGFASDRNFMLALLRINETINTDSHYVTNNCISSWDRCRDALCYLINFDISFLQLSSGSGTSPYRTKKFIDWSRICISCWQEEQYFRVFWRIDDYRVCHLHNISMVESGGFYSEMGRTRHIAEAQIEQDKSCVITVRAIDVFCKEHDSIWKIFFERWKVKYLCKVLKIFDSFIASYFNYSLKLHPIRNMLNSGKLVGSAPSCQLEKIYTILCHGKHAHEKLSLMFILVLMVKSVTFRPFSAKRNYIFENWADEKITGFKPLFNMYQSIGSDVDVANQRCDMLFQELGWQSVAEKARAEIIQRVQSSTMVV